MSGAAQVTRRSADDRSGLRASSGTLASVVATGPWMLTILSLALINVATRDDLDLDTLAAFRTIVIYAFATSLIVTAPIAIISTRMAGALLCKGETAPLLGCFITALLLGGAGSAIAFGTSAVLGFVGRPALTVLFCSSLVSLVWIALAFSTAVRDFRGILGAFTAGLVTATLAAIVTAQAGMDFSGIAAGFGAGLLVALLVLVHRITAAFPGPMGELGPPLRAFAAFAKANTPIALGAMFAAAGVWVDKWIVWSGPQGQTALSGLVHAPGYDGAMFIAYLSVVPCLALFVTILETSFTRDYRRYFHAIGAHATLESIDRNAHGLAQQTFNALMRTGRAQLIICMIFVMAAPNIVEFAGLRYEDTGLLRVGAIGTSFHFLFLACLSLLLFFERNADYLRLGALHFALNSTFTAVTLVMGTDYYGLGYLAAAVVSSLLALAAVERAVRTLTYFTFSRALRA